MTDCARYSFAPPDRPAINERSTDQTDDQRKPDKHVERFEDAEEVETTRNRVRTLHNRRRLVVDRHGRLETINSPEIRFDADQALSVVPIIWTIRSWRWRASVPNTSASRPGYRQDRPACSAHVNTRGEASVLHRSKRL